MGRSSNYSNQMYQQLQEIMGRLDSVEQDLKKEKREHKEDVERLEKLIIEKDKKIEVLTEDNERLKRILNNNSSNSSLPPSTDKKTASVNTYNTRTKSEKKAGGQIGHHGTTLTKKEVQQKLSSGKFQHRIETIGVESDTYITKYVLDLEIVPTIREIRIYATEDGSILLPKEYQRKSIYFMKEEIKTYEERYQELIQKGREENKDTKGRIAKEEETKLLNRLEKYQENHLLFLRDFSVPFENNLSERDLRKCKNRQKMSGLPRRSATYPRVCARRWRML